MLLALDVAYVARYGTNVPSWDDWDMVPTMTGRQPITAKWLWSQHNEHRIPVPRLAMLAVYRVWPDFRAAMAANVLLMGALAAALIGCAERLRGGPSVTDAFVPLSLLGLAQGLNFVWGWQLEFMLSTVFAGAALVTIALYRPGAEWRSAVVVGICVALLVMSGAHGLAVVPGLALWLPAMAWWGGRRRRLAIVGICAVCVALSATYLVGYERVPHHPTSSGPRFTAMTAMQALTMAWGSAVRPLWPVSGYVMFTALAGAALLCIRAAIRDGRERVRAVGHLCFLASMALLALAIGSGRKGFEPRYITLTVPMLCSLYLIALTYLPGRWRGGAATALLAAATLAAPSNAVAGLQYGRWLRGELSEFEKQMREGAPTHELIRRFYPVLYPQQQLLADYLPMLRDANFGAFARLAPNPPFHEISKPDWRELTIRTAAYDDFATFRLDEEVFAAGIRVRFTAENGRGVPPFFKIGWNGKTYAIFATGDRANWERGSWTRIGQPATELTAWIGERVREIRIYPDLEPCTLRLIELAVLVP